MYICIYLRIRHVSTKKKPLVPGFNKFRYAMKDMVGDVPKVPSEKILFFI